MKEEELKIKWQKNGADIMEIRGKTVWKGGRGWSKNCRFWEKNSQVHLIFVNK